MQTPTVNILCTVNLCECLRTNHLFTWRTLDHHKLVSVTAGKLDGFLLEPVEFHQPTAMGSPSDWPEGGGFGYCFRNNRRRA